MPSLGGGGRYGGSDVSGGASRGRDGGGSDTRDRVKEMQAAVDAGTYDTPEGRAERRLSGAMGMSQMGVPQGYLSSFGGVPGFAGGMAGGPSPQSWGQRAAGYGGSLIGNMLLGPLGGLGGSMLANNAASGPGGQSRQSVSRPQMMARRGGDGGVPPAWLYGNRTV